jgi:hypothetical protein
MRFTGIYRPEQLAVLSNALDEYCASRGIEQSSPDHEDASYLVMAVSRKGASTTEELRAALAGSERRQA